MKTDKYYASNPKKNGSYVDKGRVEGRPPAAADLKYEDCSCKGQSSFKIQKRNSKTNFQG